MYKDYEKNILVSEKEMAACIFGVSVNMPYSVGFQFKLVTDHKAIQYLINLKHLQGT